MSPDVSLRVLFTRALNAASKASKLPAMDNMAQELLVSSLHDLNMLMQSIGASGLFSPNETLEDIPTGHLPYLLVEFVSAEMKGRIITRDPAERIKRLKHSQRLMRIFLDRLRQYEVIPTEEQKLYSQNFVDHTDMGKRRELKIKQFKQVKELRSELGAIHMRRGKSMTGTGSGDELDLIASLLPPPNAPNEQQEDDDDDELRRVALLVIRLIWAQTVSQMESMEQELELLRNAPTTGPEPARLTEDEESWRLDPSPSKGGPDGKGPLMDSSGKPLRPFTILSTNAQQRSRLQAEVFRPDHRLPTMTIDEYLEEEKHRGNVLTGGGPQSQLMLSRSEQLILDSEMDGTVEGEMKAEEKRQEDERWARYTDLHTKGEGNTMNRG